MIKRLSLAASLAMLSACATLGITTDAQRIATACASASASIKMLVAARDLGYMTDEQAAGARIAIAAINPICSADKAPTLDDAKMGAFLGAINALQLAATQAQAKAAEANQ